MVGVVQFPEQKHYVSLEVLMINLLLESVRTEIWTKYDFRLDIIMLFLMCFLFSTTGHQIVNVAFYHGPTLPEIKIISIFILFFLFNGIVNTTFLCQSSLVGEGL